MRDLTPAETAIVDQRIAANETALDAVIDNMRQLIQQVGQERAAVILNETTHEAVKEEPELVQNIISGYTAAIYRLARQPLT